MCQCQCECECGLHQYAHTHGSRSLWRLPPPFFCFCTAVAARGLDIPAVDWIVQYDAPDEPTVSAAFFLFFSTTRNLRKGG